MIVRDLAPLDSRLNWFYSSDNLIGSFYLFDRRGATTTRKEKKRKEEMENVWITRERKYVVRRRLQQKYTKWQSTYSNATWTFDCFSLIGLSLCLDLFFLLSCVTWACARPWVFVTWPVIKAISFDAGFRSSVYRIFIDRGSDYCERRNRDRYWSSGSLAYNSHHFFALKGILVGFILSVPVFFIQQTVRNYCMKLLL